MSAPQLGFLTHVHGPGVPADELLDGVVELFVRAEERGYASGWVAQHHLEPEHGRLPSPLVLLAAVAAATSRIRLGTAVVVLGLEDPLRLAEDAAVLDALSDGRLELGLGSGAPNDPAFAAFGRDAAARHVHYDAALDVLADALAAQAPGLVTRIWESTLRPGALARAGARGHGLLLGVGPSDPVQRAARDAHAAGAASAGRAPGPVAAVRGTFPGEDRATERDRLAPDVARYLPAHVGAGWAPHADISTEELLHLMNVHYGPPDAVAASLRADTLVGESAHLIAAVQAESTTLAEAADRLERVRRDVLPALEPVAG